MSVPIDTVRARANALYYSGHAGEAGEALLIASGDDSFAVAVRADAAHRAARFFSLANSPGRRADAALGAMALWTEAAQSEIDAAASLNYRWQGLSAAVTSRDADAQATAASNLRQAIATVPPSDRVATLETYLRKLPPAASDLTRQTIATMLAAAYSERAALEPTERQVGDLVRALQSLPDGCGCDDALVIRADIERRLYDHARALESRQKGVKKQDTRAQILLDAASVYDHCSVGDASRCRAEADEVLWEAERDMHPELRAGVVTLDSRTGGGKELAWVIVGIESTDTHLRAEESDLAASLVNVISAYPVLGAKTMEAERATAEALLASEMPMMSERARSASIAQFTRRFGLFGDSSQRLANQARRLRRVEVDAAQAAVELLARFETDAADSPRGDRRAWAKQLAAAVSNYVDRFADAPYARQDLLENLRAWRQSDPRISAALDRLDPFPPTAGVEEVAKAVVSVAVPAGSGALATFVLQQTVEWIKRHRKTNTEHKVFIYGPAGSVIHQVTVRSPPSALEPSDNSPRAPGERGGPEVSP